MVSCSLSPLLAMQLQAPQGDSDPGWHSIGSHVFLQSRYISDPSLDCRNSVRVAGEGSCR